MNYTWQHRLMQRILRVSSAIHRHKEQFANSERKVSIMTGPKIIFLEVWLRVLSIPAYFFVERDAVVSAFADHPDDVVHYKTRSGILNSALVGRSKKQ